MLTAVSASNVTGEGNTQMADPRLKPVKSKRTLGEYAARVQWCEACGITAEAAASRYRSLEIHHIIKRGRSDERTNLIRLCRSCHQRAERTNRDDKSWLLIGHVLSIKKLRDPAGWDAKRLAELCRPGKQVELPALLPIPPELLAEFERWRPDNSEGEMPW